MKELSHTVSLGYMIAEGSGGSSYGGGGGGGNVRQRHAEDVGDGDAAVKAITATAAATIGLNQGGCHVGAPGAASANVSADCIGRRLPQRDLTSLATCGSENLLPMHSSPPAFTFTCYVTTRIKMALRRCKPRSLCQL